MPKYKYLRSNQSISKMKTNIKHHQTFSSVFPKKNSLKNSPKIYPKFDTVKSLSKLTYKKSTKNLGDIQLKRSKTQKKFIKTNINNEKSNLNSAIKNTNTNININTNSNNNINSKRIFTNYYKKIDYSYVKPKVETGLSKTMLEKLLNNNKKMQGKQINKKIETEKKQSIIKRCKITMNKTIENFKTMATNIKKKLFKGGK